MRRPRWYFWVGTPACLLCLLVLPILPWDEWSSTKSVCIAVCSIVFFGLAPLALFDSRRFWWATRTLTAMIFLTYAAYFIYEWFLPGAKVSPDNCKGAASPESALFSLFVFALPALWYTIFGRLTLRKKKTGDGAK